MVFKMICLVIFTLCAIATVLVPKIITEKRIPDNAKRIRVVVRIRMGCFLGMLVLMLICLII